MQIQPDFRELLALLNAHNVDYLIVGAYAMAFHGVPRSTGDIDIWIKPEVENAEKILIILNKFGFGSLGLTLDDFRYPDKVVQLGFPPVRVDLMTSISGVTWEQAVKNRKMGFYGDVSVFFLGFEELVVNKRAIGRKKDLADLESLGQ